MSKKKSESFNFETALKKLESVVETMEGGHLPLDEALKQFEEGISLIRKCQTALENAEHKVQLLTQDKGKSTLIPFESESADD